MPELSRQFAAQASSDVAIKSSERADGRGLRRALRGALSRTLLSALRTRVTYRNSTLALLDAHPSVVVCNHVSLLDGLLVALASPLPLVFAVDPAYSVHSLAARTGMRLLAAIGYGSVVPLDTSSPMGLRALHRALRAGNSVMLFAEGSISPDGLPRPAKPGFRWLADSCGAPVVELQINGAELSRIFSKSGGCLWPRIQILF